jgi:phosphate transport system protein
MNRHISEQYDAELESVRRRVLEMGGLVEQQLADACAALQTHEVEAAERAIEVDDEVNAMEVAIDDQCTHIIARRQPAASDLRLLISIIKAITDLERIGDEAGRIASMSIDLSKSDEVPSYQAIVRHIVRDVKRMLAEALDAFARVDGDKALEVIAKDQEVDQEYDAIVRQLITVMMEDARTIKRAMNTLWSVRALERIGDHAKNICEGIIYQAKGTDVRHSGIARDVEAVKSDDLLKH